MTEKNVLSYSADLNGLVRYLCIEAEAAALSAKFHDVQTRVYESGSALERQNNQRITDEMLASLYARWAVLLEDLMREHPLADIPAITEAVNRTRDELREARMAKWKSTDTTHAD
jgi:hypothetical protein